MTLSKPLPNANVQVIDTLAIIGMGLIGGSFALALKQQGLVKNVLGVGRRPQTTEKALALGLVDAAVSLEEATEQANLMVIATPVQSMAGIFEKIYPHLLANTLLIDAGSTKQNIIQDATVHLQDKIGQFVPCHPIAGSNMDGPEAAQADLFVDRRVVVCPLPENAPADVAAVHAWWRATGANTDTLAPAAHDAIYARISHLPHLIAFAYIDALLQDPLAPEALIHAGTGFKDFSRIAASSPELWRDVFLANTPAVLESLTNTMQSLERLQSAIQTKDVATIDTILQRASEARHDWKLTF